MEPEAEPTRRIEQHYILSCVDAAFLSERCSYFLSSLMKLDAGRCPHCHTLKDRWQQGYYDILFLSIT